MEDLLQTAIVGATYGTSGEVRIHPNNEGADNIRKLKKLTLQGRDGRRFEVDVVSQRMVGGQLLMLFSGYDSPEKARLLSRSFVLVPRSLAFPLKEDEVYQCDLTGCALFYKEKQVGVVKSTTEGPQALLLEVEDKDGENHLVPYMKHYIGKVDVVEKRIELLVDWILQ